MKAEHLIKKYGKQTSLEIIQMILDTLKRMKATTESMKIYREYTMLKIKITNKQ